MMAVNFRKLVSRSPDAVHLSVLCCRVIRLLKSQFAMQCLELCCFSYCRNSSGDEGSCQLEMGMMLVSQSRRVSIVENIY